MPETPSARAGSAGRPSLRWPRPLVAARFEERPHRFAVHARLEDGRLVEAHLPDPGRLTELLVPDRRIWLREARAPHRKTAFSAVLVEAPGKAGLVSVDTLTANRLVRHALETEGIDELRPWSFERAEVAEGHHRFDFALRHPRSGQRLLLEVKSVTLVKEGVGLFPDAVTERGRRHVEALTSLSRTDGTESALLFIVQRRDARSVRAAADIDPRFAATLEAAARAGVRLLARRCRVGLRGIVLDRPLPVLTEGGQTASS